MLSFNMVNLIGVVAGNCSLWNNDYRHCMVCKDERSTIRLCLQSSNACACGHCWFFDVG